LEKAGGKASDGTREILDIQIKDYVQKVNMICGSKEDVDYVCEELNMDDGNVSGSRGSYANLLELSGKFENL
jgi:hypothetical protein